MVEALPFVAKETCFALKGGTAINFFVRDMPRLSVDIDLTYTPIEDRATSLKNISDALKRIAAQIQKANSSLRIQFGQDSSTKLATKIHLISEEVKIKIEPNLIIRGTLFPTQKLELSAKGQEVFEASVEMTVVSTSDLYGGKICAALDRQHPRDLFDVKLLLENEGLTDDIRKAFIVYIASHDRPMSEVLEPTRKDISALFKNQFAGMALQEVTLDELKSVRETLITSIKNGLTQDERRFLLSLKEGNPKWDLLGASGADKLPAIQWKLMNIKKMKPDLHRKSLDRLKAVLGL